MRCIAYSLFVLVCAIYPSEYEHVPVVYHLHTITFQERTRDTLAAWDHFKGIFFAHKPSALRPVLHDLEHIRENASIEWGIAQCARLLFIAPTERCSRIRANLSLRAAGLAMIVEEADWLIAILERSVIQT